MPSLSQHLHSKYGRKGELKREVFEKETFKFILLRKLNRDCSIKGKIRKRISLLSKKVPEKAFREFKGRIGNAEMDLNWLSGQYGLAHTDLKALGEVLIHGKIYTGLSQSGFIRQGTAIKVIGNKTGELWVIKSSDRDFKMG